MAWEVDFRVEFWDCLVVHEHFQTFGVDLHFSDADSVKGIEDLWETVLVVVLVGRDFLWVVS